MDWQPIETAPKGTPKPYGQGPDIIGCIVVHGEQYTRIVRWHWHKNATTGAWHSMKGRWTPDFWMAIPKVDQ